MIHFAVLSIGTLGLLLLAVWLGLRTRSLLFPLGLGLMYYWSLFGGWWIVRDRLIEDSGFRYAYLEDKLFPIHLDGHYLAALVLYTLFLWGVAVAALAATRPRRAVPSTPTTPITISVSRVMVLSTVLGTVSYLMVWGGIATASDIGESVYRATHNGQGGASRLVTLQQIIVRAAMLPAMIGLVVSLSGSSPRLFRLDGTRGAGWILAIPVVGMSILSALLGQKNELLFAGLVGLLIYLANAERPRFGRLAVFSAVGVVTLGFVDLLRSIPLSLMASAFSAWGSEVVPMALQSLVTSNEAFGAHFSMYGTLEQDLVPNWGYSFGSLLLSIVPRAIWPDRPPPIYDYYATGVSAVPDQGYSIHHATGWYLNFGVTGVVLGAVVLGGLWAVFFNGSTHGDKWKTNTARIFARLMPCTFTAYLPMFLRAGPESYKGLAVDVILVPMVMMVLVVPGVRKLTSKGNL